MGHLVAKGARLLRGVPSLGSLSNVDHLVEERLVQELAFHTVVEELAPAELVSCHAPPQ